MFLIPHGQVLAYKWEMGMVLRMGRSGLAQILAFVMLLHFCKNLERWLTSAYLKYVNYADVYRMSACLEAFGIC
jgi:hypothetical protein